MAQCPVCHAQIADDFGLTECENCAAQLIVHMDGRVEHSGAQVPQEAPAAESEAPADDPADADFLPEPQPEPMFEAEAEAEAEADFAEEPIADEESTGDGESLVNEPAVGEPSSEEPFAEEPFTEEPQVYRPPVAADSPDLSDIADFGNSEATVSREGGLRYDLIITGIDTADVREAFREALTDRKFLWDTDAILRSIRHGEVRITNVSASKAHTLISRLRALPVKISWEQYAIHQQV
jgi:hypothetical protein